MLALRTIEHSVGQLPSVAKFLSKNDALITDLHTISNIFTSSPTLLHTYSNAYITKSQIPTPRRFMM